MNVIVVIVAGGSGTRLWPLSTPSYPKHLLKLNGEQTSLLQNTYARAKELSGDIYIISEASHSSHVQGQLPDLPDDNLIIEPARRGTANCVAAALAHLTGRHGSQEPIIFMHADHYIRDVGGFVHTFKTAAQVSSGQGRLVLVGVEPDRPAIGFGYIKKGILFDTEQFIFSVDSFKEKPDFETAKSYLKSGDYLWNCGYFVGTLDTFLASMKKHAKRHYTVYEKLLAVKSSNAYKETYLALEPDAIDYALIEKVDNLLVITAAFDWMDVGSYEDVHKAVDSDEQGNHVYGSHVELDGVENSFIQNHTTTPMAVVGLDNVVVVNTKNGILVARKDLSKQIGNVSKRFTS